MNSIATRLGTKNFQSLTFDNQSQWSKRFNHPLSIAIINNEIFYFAGKKLASIRKFLIIQSRMAIHRRIEKKFNWSLNFLKHCWKKLVTNLRSLILVITFFGLPENSGLLEIVLVVRSKVVFNLMTGKKILLAQIVFGNAWKI